MLTLYTGIELSEVIKISKSTDNNSIDFRVKILLLIISIES